jgi:hypothetical protein
MLYAKYLTCSQPRVQSSSLEILVARVEQVCSAFRSGASAWPESQISGSWSLARKPLPVGLLIRHSKQEVRYFWLHLGLLRVLVHGQTGQCFCTCSPDQRACHYAPLLSFSLVSMPSKSRRVLYPDAIPTLFIGPFEVCTIKIRKGRGRRPPAIHMAFSIGVRGRLCVTPQYLSGSSWWVSRLKRFVAWRSIAQSPTFGSN